MLDYSFSMASWYAIKLSIRSFFLITVAELSWDTLFGTVYYQLCICQYWYNYQYVHALPLPRGLFTREIVIIIVLLATTSRSEMHTASYVFGSEGISNSTGGWPDGLAFLFGLLSVQWKMTVSLRSRTCDAWRLTRLRITMLQRTFRE